MNIPRKPIVPIRLQLVLNEIVYLLLWPARAAKAYVTSLMLMVFIVVVTCAGFAPEVLVDLVNDLRAAEPNQIAASTHVILRFWFALFIVGIGIATFVTGRLPWSQRISTTTLPAITGGTVHTPHTGDQK